MEAEWQLKSVTPINQLFFFSTHRLTDRSSDFSGTVVGYKARKRQRRDSRPVFQEMADAVSAFLDALL